MSEVIGQLSPIIVKLSPIIVKLSPILIPAIVLSFLYYMLKR